AGSIGKVRAMIKRAMDVQLRDGGFAIVEVLSNCPVGWVMTPQQSIDHLRTVAETYPVGVIVDRLKADVPASTAAAPAPTAAAAQPSPAPAPPPAPAPAPTSGAAPAPVAAAATPAVRAGSEA
ncbi:MAG: hypothetical protein HY264_03985, partial [Chloroflexi bacterium]|nr:hypothetical protein [Chloroflexota bacterium]